MIAVLVLASLPKDKGALWLGKELKVIKHSLESAANRDQFRIVPCTAATVDDLRRYLVEKTPTIVHFCGHGAAEEGLCFEDEAGNTQTINAERLAKLFHLVNEDTKCVVLNACYSEVEAKAISEHIDFDTADIPQEHVPVILKSPRLGGIRLEYTEGTQKIENYLLRYLNSTPPERARMTIQGDSALGRIAASFDSAPQRMYSSVSVLSDRAICKNYREVSAILRSGLQAANHVYYLRPAGGSFLMDWDATMGQWPIAFKTFLALGASTPMMMRVSAELDNYFNFGFDPREYLSLQLRHISDGWIEGYIDQYHPDAKRLVNYLYDGKPHRIILQVTPGERTDHVLITKFYADSWILPDDAETSP
jgi:hypothetical protein